jgi:hypothetical protein
LSNWYSTWVEADVLVDSVRSITGHYWLVASWRKVCEDLDLATQRDLELIARLGQKRCEGSKVCSESYNCIYMILTQFDSRLDGGECNINSTLSSLFPPRIGFPKWILEFTFLDSQCAPLSRNETTVPFSPGYYVLPLNFIS